MNGRGSGEGRAQWGRFGKWAWPHVGGRGYTEESADWWR